MQPSKILQKWIHKHGGQDILFRFQDLRALFPHLSDASFKVLLARSVKREDFTRICKGIYMENNSIAHSGLLLFHTAALLRANHFNYISLETALSQTGVISQIPIQTVTLMSSGRSQIIDCGRFGSIEFVHTNQTPDKLIDQLAYDSECRLWRASVKQALKDMKKTRRNMDLIQWDIAHEFI